MSEVDDGLSALFPDVAYRHRMRFQQGTIPAYFGPTSEHAALLAERRRWLDATPAHYLGALPEGDALLDETAALLRSAGVPCDIPPAPANPLEKATTLGKSIEPDYMLLRPEASGAFRLVAGAVCFPSSWGIAEKMGHPLEFIHSVVPGLNTQLARPIDAFLAKIQPGETWLRSNWGLSRSPERNQHPSRSLPKLDSTVTLPEVWLRVEHQALVRLPQTGGVLFGIRIANHPLADLQRDPDLLRRFCQALETMPEPMAEYKSLTTARPRILALLR